MKTHYTKQRSQRALLMITLLCLTSVASGAPATSEGSKTAQAPQAEAREERETEQTEQLITCDQELIAALKANQILLHVQGMVCGMCVQGITKLLSAKEEVKGVEIELETGSVLVTTQAGAKLSDEVLIDAIRRAGYKLQDLHRPASSGG